jgi:signal peptide peptidase SppA
MKYMHILLAFAAEPWALEKNKLLAVANFLRLQASGRKLSAEEIQAARVTKKQEREIQKSDGAIGILPIQGVIGERMNMLDDFSGGTSTELIAKQFRAMLNDPAIQAIVLDINSPGGVARSVQELAQEIVAARGIKPIVAQVNTLAASAAYWIAAAADEIVVTPSGTAGSIGVYTVHEDISKMMEMDGIKETLIYAGEFKVLGNPLEPLSDQAKSVLQERVDGLYAAFVRSVASGRGVSLTHVNEQFGQGLMFGAEDLIKRGMADKIASMSETLARFGVDLNPALNKREPAAESAAAVAALEKMQRLQDWGRRVADDEIPPPSEFEGVLRDAGVPKSQRVRIASRMHAALRSESGENGEAATNAIARLRAAATAFLKLT